MRQGWEIKKLGDVCISDLGKTLNQSKDTGTLHPYLCAINVLWDKIDTTTLKQTKFEDGEIERYTVKKGDLLICEGGDIGRSAIWDRDESILYQNALHRVRFNGSINPRFCLLYLLHLKTSGVLDSQYGKGVTIKHLVKSSLFSIPIPVPPIAEQEKIVAELDCLSGIIEKKKQQLKELDALAQSIFYEMFGNPLRDERGWGLKRLADVCVVNPSKKVTAQGLGNKDVVSFLPMEDLPIKACYHQPDKTRLYEEVQSSYTCFANDDVLMAKVTPCFENGKLGIATNLHNGVGYGSSEFIVIRANNVDVIKEYIYFVTMDSLFIEKACAQLTGTSGLRRVPRQYVENCNITLPPLVLQQQFASKIKAIEKQKELIKQSIQETETLFNSRMDYYFN